jgi:CubicO group peptidase (beta-lactamase class C family)
MQRVQWQRSEEPHHGYGWMIWGVDGIALRGHSGGYSGFVTRIGFAPELGVAAAVLTNGIGSLAGLGIDAIFHIVGRVNALWDDSAPAAGAGSPSLGRFVGQYRGDFGEMLVGRVNRSLYLIDPDDDRPMRVAARLAPVEEDSRFLICDHEDYGHRGEEIGFELGADGRATVLHYGGNSLARADV